MKSWCVCLAVLGVVSGTLGAVIQQTQPQGWRTRGNQIISPEDDVFVFAGINWFGFETSNYVVHGIWQRGYKDMLDQVKSLGYNSLRIPYCNEALTAAAPDGIDYTQNADLQNLTPLQVLDKILDYATSIGLKIFLDRHRPDSGGQSELWYTDKYSEETWISDWVMLATRYKNNSNIIGADLHNEPHGSACWGCGDQAHDWPAAAERAGNAILQANPNWIIIVEGNDNFNNNYYWWGGNLMGVQSRPVTLSVANKVVYSTHDYPSSVSAQPWFSDPNYPNNLPGVWDEHWGYIAKQGIAPVLVGEFGTKLETESDRQWLTALVSYIGSLGDPNGWTFWCLNPNSGDTGGILEDDWQTVNTAKDSALNPIKKPL